MKFEIKNLGIVKEANLELKDLTIITGENNSGKTYIAQACFGLLNELNNNFSIKLSKDHIQTLKNEEPIIFSTKDYSQKIKDSITKITKNYITNIYKTFGSSKNNFIDSNIKLNYGMINFDKIKLTQTSYFTGNRLHTISNIQKNQFTYDIQKKTLKNLNLKNIEFNEDKINKTFSLQLSSLLFPSIAYSSAERNGVLLFQPDIDGNRSELIDDMQYISDLNLIEKYVINKTGITPIRIQNTLNRIRNIKRFETNLIGVIQEKEISEKIRNITEGDYNIKDQKITYIPKNNHSRTLNISEISSSVSSLFDLTLLLQNKPYDSLIFFDEPEMNLHPKKQREIARLIVMMINLGYKFVISTHSDIIIREINTMILLNNPTKNHILEEEGYAELETLDIAKLNCYTTKSNNDNTFSLEQIPVSLDEGIAIESFDDTIEEINRIQDRILWE